MYEFWKFKMVMNIYIQKKVKLTKKKPTHIIIY